MMGFSLDDMFGSFFKFKGFLKQPFKEKVKWILQYPLVLLLWVTLVTVSLLRYIDWEVIGRGIGKILLFPFKLAWYIIRGFFKVIGHILEAIVEFFTGIDF